MSEKQKPDQEDTQPAAELMEAPRYPSEKYGPEIDARHAGGGEFISVGNGKVRKVLR